MLYRNKLVSLTKQQSPSVEDLSSMSVGQPSNLPFLKRNSPRATSGLLQKRNPTVT